MINKTTHGAKGHNYQAIGTLCFLSRRISSWNDMQKSGDRHTDRQRHRAINRLKPAGWYKFNNKSRDQIEVLPRDVLLPGRYTRTRSSPGSIAQRHSYGSCRSCSSWTRTENRAIRAALERIHLQEALINQPDLVLLELCEFATRGHQHARYNINVKHNTNKEELRIYRRRFLLTGDRFVMITSQGSKQVPK